MTHTKNTRKRILVALDGSSRSSRTVDYLCGFPPFHAMEIRLFHVFSDVPEYYLDLNLEPSGQRAISAAQSWRAQYHRDITEFMERSRSQLLAAGLPPDAVTITIQKRERGIARDILAEAGQGYSALVARRRGFGDLPGITIGSVANKLIEKAGTLPLILAGTNTVKGSLLIAVDGSLGSDRAVRFAAEVLGRTRCSVTLCTVVRGDMGSAIQTGPNPDNPLDSAFVEEGDSTRILEEAGGILEQSGMDPRSITRRLITGSDSRAGSIARLARENGCDTLVLGRKGWSNVQDFSIGRVAWKTLHTARNHTVWIVA